jgi:Flp pilus assembly protein TadG
MSKKSALISFRNCNQGVAAIEFALVAPVLLLIMVGILFFGLYFGAVHSTSQLAADAARASVAGLSDAERADLAITTVSKSAANYPLLTPSKISVEAAPSPTDSTSFKVSVRYDASDMPIWGFARMLPLPPKIIVRTSVIKRGGY